MPSIAVFGMDLDVLLQRKEEKDVPRVVKWALEYLSQRMLIDDDDDDVAVVLPPPYYLPTIPTFLPPLTGMNTGEQESTTMKAGRLECRHCQLKIEHCDDNKSDDNDGKEIHCSGSDNPSGCR